MAFDGKFDVNRIDKNRKIFPKVLKNMFDTGKIDPVNISLFGEEEFMVSVGRNIENFILKTHKYNFCARKDGRIQTKLPTGKTSAGNDVNELYMKLYLFYNKLHTLEALFPKWLEEKKSRVNETTAIRDEQNWNKYLKDTDFVKIEIENLKAGDWIKFSRKIVGNGKMKEKCYGNIKLIINGILDDAVIDEFIPSNPIKGLNPKKMGLNFAPEEKDRSDDYMTLEQCYKLVDYLEDYVKTYHQDNHYAYGALLQIYTGVRIGELKAIHLSDINFDEKTIFIHRSVVCRRDEAKILRQTEQMHTKGKKVEANRIIPLTEEAFSIVERLIEHNASIHGKDYAKSKDNLLFVTLNNGYVSTKHFNEHFAKYCNKVGIGYHTSHDNRRFVISVLFESGVPEFAVQKYAGHLHPSTTHKYYRNVQAKKNQDVIRQALRITKE